MDSGIFYTYDFDKTYNSILKIPIFHWLPTPASNFSRDGTATMYEIVKTQQEKLVTTKSLIVFGRIFLANPSRDIKTKYNTMKTDIKRIIASTFYSSRGEGLGSD